MKRSVNYIVVFLLFICSFLNINASNKIKNPDYIEYEKLSKEEKEKIDLIPNEYINYYDVLPNKVIKYNVNNIKRKLSNLPPIYDLRNVGNQRLLPSIKNQGALGLCWAFSTNSTLESYFIKKNNISYNLSENQPDYVARFLGDTTSFGDGNSLFNLVNYWYSGYTPVSEDLFGSYFTTYKEKNLKDYMDSDNLLFDIKDVKFFPALDIIKLIDNYSIDDVKETISTYNASIKKHIVDYGALTSAVYWDFYDTDNNLVYNDGSSSFESYANSGHAITIIGWDNDYGSVTIGGEELKGSWLAMNSWGNYAQYFYVSYYDINVVKSFLGIINAEEKKWNNLYLKEQSKVTNFKDNSITYTFYKENSQETLDSVKIFFKSYNSKELNVKVSDGFNTYNANKSKNVNLGINSFSFNNAVLNGNKIYVTVENSATQDYSLGVFTIDENKESMIKINNLSNDIRINTNKDIDFEVNTRNIQTSSVLNINILDENNTNINSKYNIYGDSRVINNRIKFTLNQKSTINSKYIKVQVSYGNLKDEVKVYNEGNGSEDSPFKITNPNDLYKLNNSNAHFILEDDIDLKVDTQSQYGTYYNNSNGWNSINFYGVLDGNGHKISNLYSKTGSLFNDLSNATIKNLKIENFEINTSTSSSILVKNMKNNTLLSNILISSSKIKNTDYSSILVLNLYDGVIENIHITNCEISADKNISLISDKIYNPENKINIKNIYSEKITINNSKNIDIGLITSTFENTIQNNKSIQITNNIFNIKNSNDYIKIFNGNIPNIVVNNNNKILDNTKIKNKSNFDAFDFINYWSFNESCYLKTFGIINDVEEILLNKYKIKGDIIYNISPNTKLSSFTSNILNTNYTYKVYNKNNILTNNDTISTSNYIEFQKEGQIKKYRLSVNGDVSEDGKVTIKDILKIADYSIATQSQKEKLLNDVSILSADIDKNGKVTIADILKIANYIINPLLDL